MSWNTFLCSAGAAAAAGGVKMHVLHEHICVYIYNPYKFIQTFPMMHILSNARQHALKTFQLKCIDIGKMLESQKIPIRASHRGAKWANLRTIFVHKRPFWDRRRRRHRRF